MDPLLTPTGRFSADKDSYVLSNAEAGASAKDVIFTDTPEYQARPHKRRKRAKALAKGGMYLTETDRAVMHYIAAFGFLPLETLAELMHTTKNAMQLRTRRMVKVKILDKTFGLAGESILTITQKGLRVTGLRGFKANVQPRPTTYFHTLGEAAALRYISQEMKFRAVITERELDAFIKSGVLTPRLTATQPWTKGYTVDQAIEWQPPFVSPNLNGRKKPDLLILRQGKNGQPLPPYGVEVELSPKSPKDYREVLRTYADAARAGHLSPGLLYLVDSDDPDSRTALERGFAKAAEKWHDPIAGRNEWSNLDIKIRDLGGYFESYVARRAKMMSAY